MIRTWFFAAAVLILCLSPAAEAGPCGVPDPGESTVPKCIGVSPDGSLAYTVTIIFCNSPAEGSAAWHQLNQKALVEQALDTQHGAVDAPLVLSKQV